MQFLLSHWHCVLPVLGIGAALLLMRKKPRNAKPGRDAAVVPQNINEE